MSQYKVAIAEAGSYSKDMVNMALDNLMANLGFETGNPFSGFIKPGMKVFIKPNWVASMWRKSCDHIDDIYSVITHPSVIEAVADRVAVALDGDGEIIIGDNPSIDADFDELMELTNIKKLEQKYKVPCKIIDMRPLVCKNLEHYGKKDKMVPQTGDPSGTVQVNLGRSSLLYEMDPTLFRGVFDEREDTIAAHTKEVQLYTYGRSLYDADVYISIPKLKTHHKVGATLNLKGLVGSITEKNQLVHWRVGTPETGGDEYASREEYEASNTAAVLNRGAWPGNDTIWRMVVDLYKGMLKKERKYFSIIDGILAGEGKGPFCPTSKHSHVLLAGDSLLSTDIAAVRLMGFNPICIRYLNYFIATGQIRLEDIEICSDLYPKEGFFEGTDPYLNFEVPENWNIIKVN